MPADKAKKDVATQQIAKMQQQIAKMQVKLQDPNLSEEDLQELTEACENFQAKIDRLTK
jgi:hypothetical protein